MSSMRTNTKSTVIRSAAAVTGLAAITTIGVGVTSASAEVSTSTNQGVIQIYGDQADMPAGLQSVTATGSTVGKLIEGAGERVRSQFP